MINLGQHRIGRVEASLQTGSQQAGSTVLNGGRNACFVSHRLDVPCRSRIGTTTPMDNVTAQSFAVKMSVSVIRFTKRHIGDVPLRSTGQQLELLRLSKHLGQLHLRTHRTTIGYILTGSHMLNRKSAISQRTHLEDQQWVVNIIPAPSQVAFDINGHGFLLLLQRFVLRISIHEGIIAVGKRYERRLQSLKSSLERLVNLPTKGIIRLITFHKILGYLQSRFVSLRLVQRITTGVSTGNSTQLFIRHLAQQSIQVSYRRIVVSRTVKVPRNNVARCTIIAVTIIPKRTEMAGYGRVGRVIMGKHSRLIIDQPGGSPLSVLGKRSQSALNAKSGGTFDIFRQDHRHRINNAHHILTGINMLQIERRHLNHLIAFLCFLRRSRDQSIQIVGTQGSHRHVKLSTTLIAIITIRRTV